MPGYVLPSCMSLPWIRYMIEVFPLKAPRNFSWIHLSIGEASMFLKWFPNWWCFNGGCLTKAWPPIVPSFSNVSMATVAYCIQASGLPSIGSKMIQSLRKMTTKNIWIIPRSLWFRAMSSPPLPLDRRVAISSWTSSWSIGNINRCLVWKEIPTKIDTW